MAERRLAIPFVAAIIERTNDSGQQQVLIQTRQNKYVPEYNGTIEIVAGTLDELFENVYEALAREIEEETGTRLVRIIDDDQTGIAEPSDGQSVIGFRPFCCVQQLRGSRPWVGFIFRCEVEGEPRDQAGETLNVRWEDVEVFKQIYENSPEKIFPLELPAWEYYFAELEKNI